MRALFFCSFIVLLLSSCIEKTDSKLEITNNLNFDLYVIVYDTSSLFDYPNEVLNLDKDFVKQRSTKKQRVFNRTWEDFINNARNKRINLFLVDARVMDKYKKEEIIRRELYVKVLSFSLEEMNRFRWKVVIDTTMPNLKYYPSDTLNNF